MNNKKLQELKDDAESDAAVSSAASSLKTLLKFVNNPVDFSRLMEAIMRWMIRNKQQLRSLDTNSNFKQVMSYLNKMHSEKVDDSSKESEQSVTQK
jgi:hypothetical protein